MDANYIALSIINDLMREAMNKVEKGIEQCGSLEHQDTKLSANAKDYFKGKTEEYKKAVTIVREIHSELTERLWGAQ